MRKFDFPAAPVVLALVLGPMVEKSLRQSLSISHGSLAIFFNRPIAAFLLFISLMSLCLPLFRVAVQKFRNKGKQIT
jgi:putative tricarboxylic transport membrane protein